MILGEGGRKPIVSFPCRWKFTLIGKDPIAVQEAVELIVEKYNYELLPSRSSKKGKYYSFHLEVDTPTEEVKENILRELESSKSILLVI